MSVRYNKEDVVSDGMGGFIIKGKGVLAAKTDSKGSLKPDNPKKVLGHPRLDEVAVTEEYVRLAEFRCRNHKIDVKPLSINDAFYGRKFRTVEHRKYEELVLRKLPKLKIGNPPYKVTLVFGFSSTKNDIDNPTKIFVDCLTKKYGYDDRFIYELHIFKRIVKKGAEFIMFNIETI